MSSSPLGQAAFQLNIDVYNIRSDLEKGIDPTQDVADAKKQIQLLLSSGGNMLPDNVKENLQTALKDLNNNQTNQAISALGNAGFDGIPPLTPLKPPIDPIQPVNPITPITPPENK